jgi:hypothetical protein
LSAGTNICLDMLVVDVCCDVLMRSIGECVFWRCDGLSFDTDVDGRDVTSNKARTRRVTGLLTCVRRVRREGVQDAAGVMR